MTKRLLLPSAFVAFALLAGCDPDPGSGGQAVDADGDGYGGSDDCDDQDAAVNPGAVELCNQIDDDCDDQVDQGLLAQWWVDADGDGYGLDSVAVDACEAPSGYSDNNQDCDDTDAAVNPTAVELCNEIDDDCDGFADDGVPRSWYADADEDGADDLLVGSCFAKGDHGNTGAAYLFTGLTGGSYTPDDAVAAFWGETSGDYLGDGAALGDIDGDLYAEVILGAPYADGGGNASGAVFVQWP